MSRDTSWWHEVRIGDKLRQMMQGDIKPGYLIHVVQTFAHDQRFLVVGAWWNGGKQRWTYEVHRIESVMVGMIWRDGTRVW